MCGKVELPVGARVRVIREDMDPLHDASEVGLVVGKPEAPDQPYHIRFPDGREAVVFYNELERVDMW